MTALQQNELILALQGRAAYLESNLDAIRKQIIEEENPTDEMFETFSELSVRIQANHELLQTAGYTPQPVKEEAAE